jgi:hypothetical protein
MINLNIIFETQNLNRIIYQRLIHRWFNSQVPSGMKRRFFAEMKTYRIILRPHTRASQDPFFHGKDGLGGVTDPTKMILYLYDEHENPADSVQRVLRANAKVISHEGGHALLIWAGLNHRVPLRNDDTSGHKKGTMLPFHTAEVHDRDAEGRTSILEFPFMDWSAFRLRHYRVSVLQFWDLL